MEIEFDALEYTENDIFENAVYRYRGSKQTGWRILRNGKDHLTLGPGYRLLRVASCGICATDITRRFLPFPLPQIIGHEAVVVDEDTGEPYAVEINDTCLARGDETPEPFCRADLATHCPTRRVFGIDRLPGGFGRYVLVPKHALASTRGLDSHTAVLVEPFAAAYHAANVSTPKPGNRVAVLGPGRLGSLILAALRMIRRDHHLGFDITAVGVRERDLSIARRMKADAIIDARHVDMTRLENRFDLVFDATGSPRGFETALSLASREAHLKSTHGKPFYDMTHLTELVVDELAILPAHPASVDFSWGAPPRRNQRIYLSPDAAPSLVPDDREIFRGTTEAAEADLATRTPEGALPRFDLAIATNAWSLDRIIRPSTAHENALVRPRGAILYQTSEDTPLARFIRGGGTLRTSRCGNFKRAIEALMRHADIGAQLADTVITHRFPVSALPEAYETAKSEGAVKIIVDHE